MKTPVPAVERAVSILTFMADHPETRFRSSEIARTLQISKATCFSIMACLQEAGMLERYPDKTYALGALLATLGSAAQKRHPGLVQASTEIESLTRKFQVRCYVAARTSDEILVVEHTAPSGQLPVEMSGVRPRTNMAPPAGLVYMSWEKPDVFEAWLRTNGVMESSEQQRYRDAARIVRERGYAGGLESHQTQLLMLLNQLSGLGGSRSTEEVAAEISDVLRHGVNFLSAPVFSEDGSVTLALTIIEPPDAVVGPHFDAMVAELTAGASRVTEAIGGHMPHRR